MPEQPFDPIPTRYSLLNRLKDWGDQASWQEFFDTYWRLIYNVAARAGLSDAEAQEVVQETVIAVARKIGEFKADPARGSFGSWLMQLTRWRIADQWRKKQAATPPAPPIAAVAAGWKSAAQTDGTGSTGPLERIPDPAGGTLDALWREEWQRHLMNTALEKVKQQVSPRQFQMFDLHLQQGSSASETARALQASVASVYMASYRVGKLLKKEIRKLEHRER